jgi:hypothetical protein
MDYIIARRLRVGFELSDSKGQFVGFALTLRHAQQFAAELGVPLLPLLDAVKEE